MNGRVPRDDRVGILSILAPEVNTVDLTTLVRLSNGHDLRVVGESGVEVGEEGPVVIVRVVRVPPRDVGQAGVVALW